MTYAAQWVEEAMESENWPEVSGILAGSDAIFVAMATREARDLLQAEVETE